MEIGKRIGRGNTAEVFLLKNNENMVLKLFHKHIPHELIEREYVTSKMIRQLGISAPNVGELIEIEDKWGITYERVNGNSFTQLISSQPFSIRNNAQKFAELQLSFHGKSTDQLPSQRSHLSRNIKGTELLSEKEKQIILDYLELLPEDNKVCHGDYHSDNIIMVNGETKILDWMTGASGNPCGDIARTILIMRDSYLPPDMPKATKFIIQTVRKAFVKYYIKAYLRSSNLSFESIEKWFLPVMAARLVEGIPKPEKEMLVNKIRAMI
ncbi:aminoglycoside phosphotransferase family protein [Bacillus sp. FJAT-49736]|uniref:phosphotransferase family protein n=1 Tax=Bacillus sp. FJAT-49736 TaxID=2833582 RepID=UPI001BC9DA90|nr:aminoglycoside phosphotransferase family protein [Bacillus sp. FJAT-49736]MBS4172798.1 phosphotransferase [Bacillus sp. FJAT-49736]